MSKLVSLTQFLEDLESPFILGPGGYKDKTSRNDWFYTDRVEYWQYYRISKCGDNINLLLADGDGNYSGGSKEYNNLIRKEGKEKFFEYFRKWEK